MMVVWISDLELSVNVRTYDIKHLNIQYIYIYTETLKSVCKNSAVPGFFDPLPGVWILMKCYASRLICQCYFYFNLSTVPSLITTKINLLQSNLRVLMNK